MFTQYCEDHQTEREVLLALAGASNMKLDYSIFEKKEDQSMSCTFFEEIAREGEKRGEERGDKRRKLEDIRNLMETMKWTAEQAMTALKVPEEERSKYLQML